MRGKGQWLHKTFRCSRITPAHAGKSRLAGKVLPARRDHPRTRGEKAGCLWLGRVREGSPPHTRGKAFFHIQVHRFVGITPAHAGKSCGYQAYRRTLRDHPRTRGEKTEDSLPGGWDWGSPPHTRGKVRQHSRDRRLGGITPAHAGKRLNGSRF